MPPCSNPAEGCASSLPVVGVALALFAAGCSRDSEPIISEHGTTVVCGPVTADAATAVVDLLRGRVADRLETQVLAKGDAVEIGLVSPVGQAEAAELCRAPRLEFRAVLDAIDYDGRVMFAGTVQSPSLDSSIELGRLEPEEPDHVAAIINSGADFDLGLVTLR